MALSGLDIYKLLPKTNCRECGFATCLAFAMQLAKKAVSIDKCPYLSEEAKKILEASSQPPIKLVWLGQAENKIGLGNESVLFRHEEKFHNPTALGFIIRDSLPEAEIKKRLEKINQFRFERIGQELRVNLVAIKQDGDRERFLQVVNLASNSTGLALVLMSDDIAGIKGALEIVAGKKPLLYAARRENIHELSGLAEQFKVPLVVCALDLDEIAGLSAELNTQGLNDLILDTGKKPIAEKIWDLTQIRRQALKRANRSLGYPVLVIVDNADPYLETIEAATYIAKYASIVLVESIESWQILSLLTLRQNIYTDPQKPLQIEPKLYPVGAASDKSPVLVTTNFSLSYYTVLAEVEASRVASYIISVDTEGMSVLTAWAAEKFTPERIADAVHKSNLRDVVSHNRLIIPGYVAVMSADLEEHSGWKVTVGPKEAAGIPAFLKNLER